MKGLVARPSWRRRRAVSRRWIRATAKLRLQRRLRFEAYSSGYYPSSAVITERRATTAPNVNNYYYNPTPTVVTQTRYVPVPTRSRCRSGRPTARRPSLGGHQPSPPPPAPAPDVDRPRPTPPGPGEYQPSADADAEHRQSSRDRDRDRDRRRQDPDRRGMRRRLALFHSPPLGRSGVTSGDSPSPNLSPLAWRGI